MPRSDKPISGGSLTDPVTSARSRSWSSRAAPEDQGHFEPDGLSLVDPLTQAPVESVVNIVDPVPTAGPVTNVIAGRMPQTAPVRVGPLPVYEWTSVRTIEGRRYRRVDARHEVTDDE